MTSETEKIVEQALIDLVLDFPVFASLITRIGVQIVNNENHDACAWTDGTGIYVNEAIVEKHNADPIEVGESGKTYDRSIHKKEMMFILCHELMHLMGLTYDRGEKIGLYKGGASEELKYKWQLWNMATDYEINSLLHNNEKTNSQGRQEHAEVGKLPEWVLYDSKYCDMSAEDIYKDLYEEFKQKQQNMSSGGFTFDDKKGDGNHVDGLSFGIDNHIPMMNDTVRNEVISKMADVFGGREAGVGQSAIDRLLERTFKPEPFNWRRALTKYIRGWMKDNYTWNRPSRAGIANKLILPSSGRVPKMHIGVAVDTSGSIGDNELHTMMNHLFTILSQFKQFQVDAWCCSTKVHPETFRTFTAQNKSDLYKFTYQSDGGTYMKDNFRFINEKYKGDKLDLLIIMSDFYDELDGDTEQTSPCPCIFMCMGHDNFVPPKYIKSEVYPFNVNA
jgi:predicted metal-dependent peptidase